MADGFQQCRSEGGYRVEGITVSNVPSYTFDLVAEFVFALCFDLLRKVHLADKNMRKGLFDWKYYKGNQLMSKTIGVLGTGDIGKRVIQIAHGFNMNVLSVQLTQVLRGQRP